VSETLGDAASSNEIEADEIESSVRRVFQAIPIEVDDERGALDGLLRRLPGVLRPGGRAALLSFHSREDRRIKKALQNGFDERSPAPTRVTVVIRADGGRPRDYLGIHRPKEESGRAFRMRAPCMSSARNHR
jgi:16S rRNA C1402 N4-methylase RsmH